MRYALRAQITISTLFQSWKLIMEPEGPVCSNCKTSTSLMWQRNKAGAVVCLECHTAEKTAKSTSSTPSETSSQNSHGVSHSPPRVASPTVTTRRATRSREKTTRANKSQSSSNGTKGNEKPTTKVSDKTSVSRDVVHVNKERINHQQRSRRSLLKQSEPMKSPESQPVIITSDSVVHKGTTYEVGDIVSLLDRDGGVYYAVIRGFLQDQYAEKHAVLTWLLPRHPNPMHFDPALFVLGPEEDVPRPMEYINFVSHSPQSRHFQASYFHDYEQAELWRHT